MVHTDTIGIAVVSIDSERGKSPRTQILSPNRPFSVFLEQHKKNIGHASSPRGSQWALMSVPIGIKWGCGYITKACGLNKSNELNNHCVIGWCDA